MCPWHGRGQGFPNAKELGILGPVDAVGENAARAPLVSGGVLPLEDASPGLATARLQPAEEGMGNEE